MPQMSPLMWLSLMIFFFSVYMIFMMMNYFNLNYHFYSKSFFKEKKLLNWKW